MVKKISKDKKAVEGKKKVQVEKSKRLINSLSHWKGPITLEDALNDKDPLFP